MSRARDRGAGPIRVLAIDHTAGVAPFRRKFEALARRPEIDLTVLAPDRWVENYQPVRIAGPRELALDGYCLRTGPVIWPGYENRGFFVGGIRGAMRRARPEILHLWEEPFSLIALEALIARRLVAPRSQALFFTSDNLSTGFRYPYRPSSLYGAIERWTYRQCAAAGAVTELVRDVLRSKGYPGPIDILPHGLDLDDFPEPSDERRREAKRAIGARGTVIGYAGRLLAMKGVDLLLRAAAPVLAAEPDAEVVIVGEGPVEARLRGVAAELGCDRVRFLPPVPHDAMPALLAAFDITVMPSLTTPGATEQFGRVALEAMAAGSAVVVSSSGGLPLVVGDAGIVVPEGDVEAMRAVLQRLVRSPEVRADWGRQGRERVRARFTWDRIAQLLVARYAALLERAVPVASA